MKMLMSEYTATGEGTTICIMVTNFGSFEDNLKQKFERYFGEFYSMGVKEIVDEEEERRFHRFIPLFILEKAHEPAPVCSMVWHGSFHMNCY